MASAISSLPVPVSPLINTVASVGATIRTIPSTRRRASLLPTIRGEPLSQSSFLPRWAFADTESSASKDAPRLTTGASPTQHVCVAIFYSFRLSTALSTLAHQSRAGLNREVLQLSEPCPLASLPGSNTFFLTFILDRFVFVYTPRSELRGMPRSRFLVVPLLGYPTSTSRYGWVSHERAPSWFYWPEISIRFRPNRCASTDHAPGPSIARAAPKAPSRTCIQGSLACDRTRQSSATAISTPATGVHKPTSNSTAKHAAATSRVPKVMPPV